MNAENDFFRDIGLFSFHRHQQKRFKYSQLWLEWVKEYPMLFDADDLRLAQTQAHIGYHFYEWLAAILLYHSTGYLSLVEQYEFKNHERKQELLEYLLRFMPGLLGLIRDHHDRKVQCPDLLVYAPNLSDWFFCEVKGPGDSLHQDQETFFEALAREAGRRIGIIRFQETQFWSTIPGPAPITQEWQHT